MYWITGILGVALVTTPFLFGFQDNTPALYTAILVGAAVALVSAMEGLVKDNNN